MKMNLMTPINQLGYGVVGINILKALQAEIDVSLHVIGQPQVTNEDDASAVRMGLEAAKTFDSHAPCVKIWHQNQMAEFAGKGQRIGFPIFELDTFTDIEKHHLQSCDKLFVCSQWAKSVIHEAYSWGVSHQEVCVIPLGVDADIFKPATPRNTDKTIFFNCGKWEIRKGHDILIEAFKMAEMHDPNVELWMMCTNPFNSPEEENKWRTLYNHPKVRIIPRAETQQEVYNIMSQVDCGVFPSRAEGWNLELLEMMSCGRHVIATDYSAHTEFCTKENCGLVSIGGKEPAYDGKWFFNQGNWARIAEQETLDLSIEMQKFILNNKNTINKSGIETAKLFSWQNSARKIRKIIENDE